ncbi:hypothetical protein DVH05_006052 [Phytophthora capsici]|nr:hypothetical protein DVH05_006051 [Phytophthora capsici]KAG1704039.1 hypothetical protein DVH05_006052 [Phytophthora capsici]
MEATGASDFASQVAAVKSNVIGAKTTSMYLRGISRYLVWLYSNRRNVLSNNLLQVVEHPDNNFLDGDDSHGHTLKLDGALYFLEMNPSVPPIQYELHNASDFEQFIMSLKSRTGEKPGQSVYDSMRSRLFHLYRRYGRLMSVEFAADLTMYQSVRGNIGAVENPPVNMPPSAFYNGNT